MQGDASLLEDWDYCEYHKFAPKASNNVWKVFTTPKKDLITSLQLHWRYRCYFPLSNTDVRELQRISVQKSLGLAASRLIIQNQFPRSP